MDEFDAIIEERRIQVTDGEVDAAGSWIYAWVRPLGANAIAYIGSTGIPPDARTWLHLHHEDPAVGRVRTDHPEALTGEVEVRAFRIHPDLDRRTVRDAVTALTAGESVGTDREDPCFVVAKAILAALGDQTGGESVVIGYRSRVEAARTRAEIVGAALDASVRWREFGAIVSAANATGDAIASLTEPPFLFSQQAAAHIVDMPIRRLTAEGRAQLEDELAVLREFLDGAAAD